MKTLLHLFLLIPFTLFSQTIYVDVNASGSNDGSDWTNAYNDLQTAITNIGSNTNIDVAQGTYYTTSSTDRTIYFNVPSGKKIHGGFPSGGGERDPNLHPTILSGDIGVIDNNTDNSYHVVVFSGTNSSTEIDGFIIEKGYADGSGSNESNGGGVFISTVDYGDSNAFIRNCTIRNNHAKSEGGGILVSKRAEIYNCKIYSNSSGDSGGGISIRTNGRIYNSYIVNNKSVFWGGGIKITGINSAPKAINCVIANNEVEHYGAGAYLAEGILVNCTITNNKGNHGVHFGSYGAVYNSILWGNSSNQITHSEPTNSHGVKRNLIQDIITTENNIGVSSKNDGSMFNFEYPRFKNPTSFTGNATTPEQLEEILNANWYINPQSAAIDFGDNSTYPTTANTPITEITGNNRTINTTMDSGAFEAMVNIETKHATNQLTTSATLNGEILFAETSNTIHRGFVYSETSNFDVNSTISITNSETGLGAYAENITNLTEKTFYYYRAWTEFEGNKYYGKQNSINIYNLVAYYPFNGNANDESGNGNPGIVNGATLASDRFGKADEAYYFDGSTDYILIPNNPNINIDAGRSFSISYWIKHDASNVGKYMISKYNGSIGAEPSYALGTGTYGDSYSWFEFTAGNGKENRGNIDLNDNEWHNITTVFKSGESINIYIDGELDKTENITHTGSIVNTRNLTIGCGANIAQFYKGYIDDIKIYNYALSNVEINNEAKSLIAYYPFNGNANDESGNENHGTVNGATLTTDRFGNTESAYSFDGNDRIDIASNSSLNFENELSMSAWINLSSLPASDIIIIGKSNYYTATNYLLRIRGDGRLQFEYKINSFTSTTPIVLNQWNHILVMSNGMGDVKFHINGTETVTSDPNPSPSGLVTNQLTIGYSSRGAEYFNGSIDDVRIYNKTLTSTEISDLYDSPILGFPIEYTKHGSSFYVSDNTLFFRDTQKLNDIKNMSVYNMLGQKVFETSNIKDEIEFNYLENGTYVLKIFRNNNLLDTGKFIIQ